MTATLLLGNARAVLATLPERSVQCVVTSPPYWAQRRYAGAQDGMIGNEPTPEVWAANLVDVFRAVRRVLRDDGTLWVNCGDKYAGSGGAGGDYNEGGLKASANGTGPGASQQITVGAKQMTHPGSVRPAGLPSAGTPPSGYKSKDMIGLPWLLAFALRADGWYLRSEIIWHKLSPMPQSVTDRPTTAHEQLFLFAKSGDTQFWTHRTLPGRRTAPEPDYRWNLKGQAERLTAPDGWQVKVAGCGCCGGVKEHHWTRENLWATHDYFYDAEAVREELLRPEEADRKTKARFGGANKHAGYGNRAMSGNEYDPSNLTGRNARSVQSFAPSPFSLRSLGKYGPLPEVDHYALFPISLPMWCIRAGTSERGCCPKCGAPWVRQTQASGGSIGRSWHDHDADPEVGQRATDRASKGGHGYKVETTGWAASCACPSADPVPCTVLDPFMGAGTTALAAGRLGRNSIGIELSPDYLRLAQARMHEAAPLLGAAQ